jgi:O-antigen/teichoic acid export membrane protein
MKGSIREIDRAPASRRAGMRQVLTERISAAGRRFPLASKGLLSIFDQAIFSGTSFLTAVLIGRATSPGRLGTYYLVLSIVLVISSVQDQLISAPYVIYSKRRQGRDLAEYAGSIWAHHLAVTFAAMFGVLTAAVVLSITGESHIAPALWALLGIAPLLLIRQEIRRFTFANLDLKSAVLLDVAVALFQLAGLLLLSFFGWSSLFTIFGVMGGACGLASAGWYLFNRPAVRFVRARFMSDWRHNWQFSKWALQTYVLGNTTPQLMLWLVSATAGTAATGVFGACNNLIGISYVVLCGVANVLTPQAAHAFAAGGVKDLRRVLMVVGSFFALTMGALCLLILVTGDWLVIFAFGPHYHGTGSILFLLGLSATMNALSILTGNGLWAIDQPRSNFLADVCCMTVTLIVAAMLVLPFGAFGAALATLAGATAAAVVRSFTLMRRLGVHACETDIAITSALPSQG